MKRLEDLTSEELEAVAKFVGQYLLRLPTTASFARHRRPLGTLRNYIDPPTNPLQLIAWQYLQDLLRAPHGSTTQEMIDKWGTFP